MSDSNKNILGSYRFWIFVVALSYFGHALYFAIYGLGFSVGLIFDHVMRARNQKEIIPTSIRTKNNAHNHNASEH